ncbi:cold-shock protein [Sphingosinicella humi]|uniref:FunZ protein n=1 Tax=Allosphingosinicella humi TaxID=2068657 RepID=A0A2U2J3I8_9SPHN|nr:cold shock domain-containing protein [Sphingosinicella humi]PWG02905.1 funZ protein [Sphingosinicella humi]
MKPLNKLTFGFADAENYRRRENKNLFNQIFLRTEALEELTERNTFFLVGEKGTGKTAYAVYLTNSPSDVRKYSHKFIRETDYTKFVALKNQNALGLSEYVDIWKVILLLLVAGSIIENEARSFAGANNKFKGLKAAIDAYYQNAFSPEVVSGLQLVENSEEIIKMLVKFAGLVQAGADVKQSSSTQKNLQRFQTDLLTIQRSFENAISSLNLTADHTVFIDGIDIRPESIPYPRYQDCVKGLANALWSLNNDFFPSIRDSKGRIKVVALLRPDIFNSLGMQNRNTKLKDNSTVLDWRTRYHGYRESNLFKMADRFLSVQQDTSPQPGVAWDHYFPFNAASLLEEESRPTSFITVLRYSFHRPRDILAVLDTLDELYVRTGQATDNFTYEQLTSKEFRRAYGTYMLGEVKDSLSFYYGEDEYELFLKFFEYLDGHNKFDYSKFLSAYADFVTFIGRSGKKRPDFMETAEDFLQFLYDQNIISYIEMTDDERFIRWCFIERSPSNISPKVKTNMDYEIHYGLGNVLNTGKKIRSRRKSGTAVVAPSRAGFFEGTVKFFKISDKFGFIVQDGMPVDMFFHGNRVIATSAVRKGDRVRFRLEKDQDGRLMAVDVMHVKGV